MPPNKDKPFPANPKIVTSRYRGPDRRGRYPDEETDTQPSGEVVFDAKGNPVWRVRVDVPRRRKDDDTIDMLKRLEVDSLSLADDDNGPSDAGYDPYLNKNEPSK
jgi:hypothetical protein